MNLKRISTAELENELLDRHRKERLCRNETAEEERIFETYFSKFEVGKRKPEEMWTVHKKYIYPDRKGEGDAGND